MKEYIKRSFSNFQITEENIIKGIPIVFEKPTDICGLFEETISRDAIDLSLFNNVDLFYNHNLNTKPIARAKNGKLTFEIKEDGVHMTAYVNRERSDVNDLYLAIKDGDIEGMSFMFRVSDEEWSDLETNYPKRRITKIESIREVSIVNEPAYKETSVSTRSINEGVLLDAKNKSKENINIELLKAKYLFKI